MLEYPMLGRTAWEPYKVMTCRFIAEPEPSIERCAEVAAFAPANPFYTWAYIEYRRLCGFQPWVLSLRQDGQQISTCTAFMRSRYLYRSLAILSLPALPDANTFWDGLLRFCRETGVSHLAINSFASVPCVTRLTIPALPGEIRRRVRYEYALELQQPSLWKQLSSNHMRNINRGRRAGLQVRHVTDEQAGKEHALLVAASMGRRRSRGESVPETIRSEDFIATIRSGAGELCQVVLNGRVLSSIMILKASSGGYYQSAGTSPEGMSCGASHILVYEIANSLRAKSMRLFNLGGVDQLNTGLARFKSGFGAVTTQLEAAEFFVGGKLQNKLTTIARSLRQRCSLGSVRR